MATLQAAFAAATALVEKIKPVLAGHEPWLQGYALAELTVIWLAGHVVPSDQDATDSMRRDLLQMLAHTVQKFLALNEPRNFDPK